MMRRTLQGIVRMIAKWLSALFKKVLIMDPIKLQPLKIQSYNVQCKNCFLSKITILTKIVVWA